MYTRYWCGLLRNVSACAIWYSMIHCSAYTALIIHVRGGGAQEFLFTQEKFRPDRSHGANTYIVSSKSFLAAANEKKKTIFDIYKRRKHTRGHKWQYVIYMYRHVYISYIATLITHKYRARSLLRAEMTWKVVAHNYIRNNLNCTQKIAIHFSFVDFGVIQYFYIIIITIINDQYYWF